MPKAKKKTAPKGAAVETRALARTGDFQLGADLEGYREHELGPIAARLAEEAEQEALGAAHKAAEAGRILRWVKGRLEHGDWLPWLKEHWTKSEDRAHTYMRLARAVERVGKFRARAEFDRNPTIRKALAALSPPAPPKKKPAPPVPEAEIQDAEFTVASAPQILPGPAPTKNSLGLSDEDRSTLASLRWALKRYGIHPNGCTDEVALLELLHGRVWVPPRTARVAIDQGLTCAWTSILVGKKVPELRELTEKLSDAAGLLYDHLNTHELWDRLDWELDAIRVYPDHTVGGEVRSTPADVDQDPVRRSRDETKERLERDYQKRLAAQDERDRRDQQVLQGGRS